MGAQVMPDWNAALTDWLKPFVEKLGLKERRQMYLLYVAGLIGPGERKRIKPLATGAWRLIVMTGCIIISDGMWDAGPIEVELARVV
jgi:hypothetical protein